MVFKPFIIIVILSAIVNDGLAQDQPYSKHKTDPLIQQLRISKTDTTRIKICYEIGIKDRIKRIGYWDSLLMEAEQHSMALYQCKILTRIGILYYEQGDPVAIKFYYRSLAIAEQIDDLVETINVLKEIEFFYSGRFERKQALYIIFKAIHVAERYDDKKSLTYFYSKLGNHYSSSGDISKALSMHLRCLQLAKDLDDELGIINALLDIGSTYTITYDYQKATPYYLESKKHLASVNNTPLGVQILCSVSEVYRYVKQYDSAYHYIRLAYDMANHSPNKRTVASVLAPWSWLDFDHGDLSSAKARAEETILLCKATQFTAQLPSLYQLLKKIYLKQGNYKKALEIYECEITLRDSLSNESVRKQALEEEHSYDLEKKESEYKLLAQQNQIQTLKLNQDRYLFFALGSLILVVLTIAYLFIRQNRFRTEHQRVHLEQKLLRSQMNPHFVFNSLNSIQQFIMSGKNDLAEIYLSKFAKLIRDLLESNIKESLTLQEEIEILTSYLEMESLRFGNTFSYSMHTDERIDVDQTNIPHLMIQPFVENAIWHGLLSKTGDRVLRIAFEYHAENAVKCIVDDNGIGREESMKKESTFRKKSLALSFVQQRIDLIKRTHKITGNVTITDKKNANNESLGTRVVIILPILKP